MTLEPNVEHTPAVLAAAPLSFPWQTLDPFLVCVYHHDAYPAGNGRLGPSAPLAGRSLGNDFGGKDGWSMYHGEAVPGFPAHPHRGFETVTIVRRGLVDHADSLGAAARYGQGDVQWLTAGGGIQHSEMFPLLRTDGPNPLDLFQIWLNLPRASKRAAPHFAMFWADRIPRHVEVDAAGRRTEVVVVAGALGETRPLPPPPESWAARPDADVAIWTIRLTPGARWRLPPARAGSTRALYLFRGPGVGIDARELAASHMVQLAAEASPVLQAGAGEAELLLLQGRPIDEPVVQHGPFVGSSREEIQQAFADYRRTQFGGWPWESGEPVHPREEGRFARHPDGRVERPDPGT
jgi:redox-sensitive bicupin YhaK (pirin superfamily)